MTNNEKTRRSLTHIEEGIRARYAWPGGYPLSIIFSDGFAICPDCARKNWREIVADSLPIRGRGCWRAEAAEILWEGGNHCGECGECLDAYPQEEEEAE